MVDEVADFSPLQLGCMGALTEPRLNSFFACGDFNQRITEFGITSQADLAPFFPDIDVRAIEITYRHTRQLSEFVACPEGKVIGQENDVRVFDVQHIKGLEFEAVSRHWQINLAIAGRR